MSNNTSQLNSTSHKNLPGEVRALCHEGGTTGLTGAAHLCLPSLILTKTQPRRCPGLGLSPAAHHSSPCLAPCLGAVGQALVLPMGTPNTAPGFAQEQKDKTLQQCKSNSLIKAFRWTNVALRTRDKELLQFLLG